MPRGTQFGQVITMFREEAGLAVNRSQGQNDLPRIKAKLRRVYRRLHADFEWPHLKIEREKQLQAGERYPSFPADLDYDNIWKVWVREAGDTNWYPLRYGIGIPHYNTVASDEDEREDFPHSWQIHEGETFEIWPIPVSNGHTLKFYGRARAKPLVNENEVLDLDDDLVILFAVAEEAARQKSPEAQLLLEQARVHYMRLRGNSSHGAPVDMRANRDRGPRHSPINIQYAEVRDRDA